MIFRKITIFGQSCQKIAKNTKIQFALKIDLKAKNQFLARFWKARGLLFRFLCLKMILEYFCTKNGKKRPPLQNPIFLVQYRFGSKKALKMNLLMRNFYEPKIWTLSFLNPVSECFWDAWFIFQKKSKFGEFCENRDFADFPEKIAKNTKLHRALKIDLDVIDTF